MQTALTFIVPVRHQDNAKDWASIKKNLTQTLRSISRQSSDDWQGVVVANHGADLPPLPDRFVVKRVGFAPNEMHEQGANDLETFRDAFRIDKGRRALAGMLFAGKMTHVMIVDDDDFVSRNLAVYAANHPQANGWYIRDGYVWGEDDRMVYAYSDFSRLCGSSHIVRADLYNLPSTFDAASDIYIRKMLGSHIFIREHLDSMNTPLAPLPFAGAVYRVGHRGAHSRSSGMVSQFFLKKFLLKRPLELCRRIARLRPLTKSLREEFFGHW